MNMIEWNVPGSLQCDMNEKWKKRGHHFWKEWVKPFVVIGLCVFSFRSAIADWNDVPTGSMKPTIMEGDRIFVNKLAYDLKIPFTTVRLAEWDDPERGEIVVFFAPTDGTRMVKRVIGLPGDTIELADNTLIVNGAPVDYEPLDEWHVSQIPAPERPRHEFAKEGLEGAPHPVMATPDLYAPRSFGPSVVPEGHFFVMGDNRDNSMDSRYYGAVERKRIVGRATSVVGSVDRERGYRPRWGRFFRSLP